MALKVNAARGEVLADAGGVEIVLCAEMERLAALSARLNCQSLQELYGRLIGSEPRATLAAVEILAVKGDAERARKALGALRGGPAMQALTTLAKSIAAALAAHMNDDDGDAPGGNSGAAGEAASS